MNIKLEVLQPIFLKLPRDNVLTMHAQDNVNKRNLATQHCTRLHQTTHPKSPTWQDEGVNINIKNDKETPQGKGTDGDGEVKRLPLEL